jgi:hypothetical protein
MKEVMPVTLTVEDTDIMAKDLRDRVDLPKLQQIEKAISHLSVMAIAEKWCMHKEGLYNCDCCYHATLVSIDGCKYVNMSGYEKEEVRIFRGVHCQKPAENNVPSKCQKPAKNFMFDSIPDVDK